MRRILCFFPLMLFLLCLKHMTVLAQVPEEVRQQEVSCDTGSCHPGQLRHASSEVQPGECRNCHKVEKGHESKGRGTGENPQQRSPDTSVCAGCHPFSGKYWHPPTAANDCLACHVYHSEDRGALIGDQDGKLCTKCHLGFIEEGMMQHLSQQKTGGKSECSFCHSAHVAPFPGLLNAPTEKGTYVNYTDQSYAFCFSCHSRNILQFADTMHYTGFRNGKKNLHFLHSNKQRRGLNCIICHDTHQSLAPALIVAQAPYGDWNMPMNFNKTENGGSCAPGCHPLKTYERASYGTTTRERSPQGRTEADRD